MLFFNIIIIILLTLIDNTNCKIPASKVILFNNLNKQKIDKASECITQIAKEYISCNNTLFIVSSSNRVHFSLRPINDYYCFSIITRSFVRRRWRVYPNAYFISAKNATDLLKGLHEISEDLTWNPTAKFVILFSDKVHEITEIFEELINLMIFNVVLLINTKNDKIEAFTYYLQSGGYCGRNISKVRNLGHCPKFSATLFPNKVQKSFKNCTISVTVREDLPYVMVNNTDYVKYIQTGAEQYFLNTIAKYEGVYLKYNYVKPDEDVGLILPNRNGTGLMGYLQRHETDIAAGGLFLSGKRLEVFDCFYGYSFATFSIFTPTMHEEKWRRVYKPFGVVTWFLIILSFLVTVIVILVTKNLTSGKSKDTFLIILKLWRYFYGHADERLFQETYIKRFLIAWIIFTSSINAFYNTASYSLITGHVKDKIHIDYKNLDSLPFRPCINEPTRVYFLAVYNEIFPKNNDEDDALCQNIDTTFNNVANRYDLYAVDSDYTYDLRAINYRDEEGQPTINKWDYPRTNILTMCCIKGFPLRKKFQNYATWIHETGLLQRYLALIYTRKPKPIPPLMKKYNVMRLEDFIIHYSILIVGSTISLICFIIEYKTVKQPNYVSREVQ